MTVKELSDFKTFDELAYAVSTNPSSVNARVIPVNKFGLNNDIDTTKADIWSAGGTKTNRDSSDYGTVEVVSSSGDDTAAGSGAQAVIVQGYDSEGNFTSDWQELNGTTAVELDVKMWDVYRAYVVRVGSGGYNAGVITIRHKTGPVTLAAIPFLSGTTGGFNQTQMSQFMIPKGFTGKFLGATAVIGGLQGGGGLRLGDLHLELKLPNEPWRILDTFGATSNSGPVSLDIRFPFSFPELSKVKASCTTETANTRAYAQYNLLLIGNEDL